MAKAKQVDLPNIEASTGENARIIARLRLEEVYSWDPYVDEPYNVRGLHNLRIATKRLRYTLETFAEVLPALTESVMKELEQIQDELGSLHDSDVMIALLRLFLCSQDAGTGYVYALKKAKTLQVKGKFLLNPDLVAQVLGAESPLSAEDRYGLEQLLMGFHKCRE